MILNSKALLNTRRLSKKACSKSKKILSYSQKSSEPRQLIEKISKRPNFEQRSKLKKPEP